MFAYNGNEIIAAGNFTQFAFHKNPLEYTPCRHKDSTSKLSGWGSYWVSFKYTLHVLCTLITSVTTSRPESLTQQTRLQMQKDLEQLIIVQRGEKQVNVVT